MENIFIDASIFIKENFLEGKRIRQLLKLGEEEQVQIVLTRITVNEVKSKFSKLVKSFVEHSSKQFYLRNIQSGNELLESFDGENLAKEFHNKFDLELKKAKAIIIEYESIKIDKLLSNYFEELPPFNSKNKKNEFPDAITIQLIEEWCKKNRKHIKTLSTDKDFEGYASEFVKFEQRYEEYIDYKIKSFELYTSRIALLSQIVKDNDERIDLTLKEWHVDKLWDESLYWDYYYGEIHHIEMPDVEIVEKTYQITYIDDEKIEIEIFAIVWFEIEIEVDDEDYGFYDNEEKEMLYTETKIETIRREVNSRMSAIAYIKDENQYDKALEFLEINKNMKFKIDIEN